MRKIYRKIMNARRQKREMEFFQNLEPVLDFEPIVNICPNKVENITFILPGMMAYSGGHTSVLRLGTHLANMGYRVSYTTFIEQDINEMKENARINLQDYRGEIYPKKDLYDIKSDVVVATAWESAYFAKKIPGYKMYFVQDYEPFFHMYGEKFLMAKKTYELGLHMVSLGKWNKYMVESNCEINGKFDYITFPYERKEYKTVERNYDEYPGKREINMAVFIKDTGKRAPYIIQSMLGKVKEKLEHDGLMLNISYYGEDKSFGGQFGENLGKLSKPQLFELYKRSDVGMVASLTNVSLVPYEMLATGLPIIEFKEGTFKYFFSENSAILTSFDWRELYSKLKDVLGDSDKLKNMMDHAQKDLANLSWENTAKEFEEILKKSISSNK